MVNCLVGRCPLIVPSAFAIPWFAQTILSLIDVQQRAPATSGWAIVSSQLMPIANCFLDLTFSASIVKRSIRAYNGLL